MDIILKIILLPASIILVCISFFLAGSGQDNYFYAGCGFGLAGILVFMMFMRPKKEKISAKTDSGAEINIPDENQAEEK